tara:strand:+ start:1713 stop:2723 length:1011 start_codon:yes stop_codon:yes gene_type:complete
MSYIGKIPTIGNFVKLDAITTSSTNTYNLTLDSVAFSPESPNHCLVSLNGVIQAPTTSFSISGSTITFIPSSGTLASSDSIDFIMVYGNVLDLGVPSDATVTNAKTNFVSTSSAAGLQIKGDGTTDGTLQLNCSQNSHGIKLKSPPHSASASYTLTFPTTDGNADEFLQTNGSGTLTWATAGGGGKINQVLQTVKTDTFSSSSTSFVDVTGLSRAITPSATDSKILVNVTITVHSSDNSLPRLLRDSTVIALGDAAGNRTRTFGSSSYSGHMGAPSIKEMSVMFLDSPNTTSSVTYKVQGAAIGGGTIYFGRGTADTDNAQHPRTIQTITCMEVLA